LESIQIQFSYTIEKSSVFEGLIFRLKAFLSGGKPIAYICEKAVKILALQKDFLDFFFLYF